MKHLMESVNSHKHPRLMKIQDYWPCALCAMPTFEGAALDFSTKTPYFPSAEPEIVFSIVLSRVKSQS